MRAPRASGSRSANGVAIANEATSLIDVGRVEKNIRRVVSKSRAPPTFVHGSYASHSSLNDVDESPSESGNGVLGPQTFDAPSQVAETRQSVVSPHSPPAGSTASEGQVSELPVHVSATSQVVSAGRHVFDAGSNWQSDAQHAVAVPFAPPASHASPPSSTLSPQLATADAAPPHASASVPAANRQRARPNERLMCPPTSGM